LEYFISTKICPNAVCTPLDDNLMPIYGDSEHMTASFVKSKVDVLDNFLKLLRGSLGNVEY
tara:strand:- start:14817 stop:14999 length:183 start_codon:yes stop_codon:yes gene_type:complete